MTTWAEYLDETVQRVHREGPRTPRIINHLLTDTYSTGIKQLLNSPSPSLFSLIAAIEGNRLDGWLHDIRYGSASIGPSSFDARLAEALYIGPWDGNAVYVDEELPLTYFELRLHDPTGYWQAKFRV